MTDYTNTFGGAAKDTAKDIILGAQHDTEYDALATMSATKGNKIAGATNNNVMLMDANGDLKDALVQFDQIARRNAANTFTIAQTFSQVAVFTLGTTLPANDIITADINAAAITLAKMAANSVDSDQYVDGSIDLVHLSADSVDGSKMVDNAVNSEHYTDGSIDLVHMSANSVDSNQYVDGSIDVAHMAANSIDSAQYVDGSIDLIHLSTDSVDQAKIAAAAVGQGELNTASGEVSTTQTDTLLTLPGGQYGFYPRLRGSSSATTYNASLGGHDTAENWGTAFLTRIVLDESGAFTAIAEQTYIQASPPYNLGDGDIPLFVFAHIDNATGDILSTYVAPEAPWHYNGSTIIVPQRTDPVTGKQFRSARDLTGIDTVAQAKNKGGAALPERAAAVRAAPVVEFEITQAIKNADINLVPHPFDPVAGQTIVMLDPVSTLMQDFLELHESGESISDLLYEGFITIGNNNLQRGGPTGLQVPSCSWK